MDNVGDRHSNRKDWFRGDFWDRHDYRPRYRLADGNAWGYASWAGVTGWVGWGWGDPYYYGYDDDDGSVYADTSYEDQTETIASSSEEQEDSEWMSLGVFALAKDREAIGSPNVYIQLVLNKEGDLAGTYYNTTTDKTYPLEGVVDKESQRAAWMMSDSKNSPILETGIYNLTKEETPISVTYADNRTQDMLMVRLEDPQK